MEFKHCKDEERARKYLQDIGVYEHVVQNANDVVFNGNYPLNDGFLMIIAANREWEERNK